MHVHAAFVAQRCKTRMHFRRDRAGVGAARGILRPQFLFGKFFREVFEDRKRIPDRDIAVDQRRNLAGERKAEDAVLVRLVVGIERDEHLVEGDGIGAQRQPCADIWSTLSRSVSSPSNGWSMPSRSSIPPTAATACRRA